MYSRVTNSLRNSFQRPFSRYLVVSLIILGIVLIVTSQQMAEPIPVVPEQPPNIEALEVTKDRYEHCYLIEEDISKYKVGKGQKYDIECIVSDTSIELFYEWSCDDGEISESSEDGSMIVWTAPDTSNPSVTVTVTVSDIADNMVSESMTLNVVTCSSCTFKC